MAGISGSLPVVRIQKNESRAGGAANVALNTAALGTKTRLLGVVGKDEPARLLREALALGLPYGLMLHDEPDFELIRNHETFVELLRPLD